MEDSEACTAKAIADIEKAIECANEVKRQRLWEAPKANPAVRVVQFYSEKQRR